MRQGNLGNTSGRRSVHGCVGKEGVEGSVAASGGSAQSSSIASAVATYFLTCFQTIWILNPQGIISERERDEADEEAEEEAGEQ